MQTLGQRVKHLRTKKGITQGDLASKIGGSTSNVSRIEKDEISPAATVVLQICKFFDVSADWLLVGEEDHPKGVRQAPPLSETPENSHLLNGLDDIEKKLVLERIQTLIDVRKAKEAAAAPPLVVVPPAAQPAPAVAPAAPEDDEDADEDDDTIEMLIYDEPAAAGYGFDRDEWAGAETLPFPASEVARGANFGIRVSGDSMEPDIEDGSIVWVRDGVWVDSGQIGVFVYNNRVFCKKLRQDPETQRISLVSSNKRYKPIPVTAPEEFHLVGKVLGVFPGQNG